MASISTATAAEGAMTYETTEARTCNDSLPHPFASQMLPDCIMATSVADNVCVTHAPDTMCPIARVTGVVSTTTATAAATSGYELVGTVAGNVGDTINAATSITTATNTSRTSSTPAVGSMRTERARTSIRVRLTTVQNRTDQHNATEPRDPLHASHNGHPEPRLVLPSHAPVGSVTIAEPGLVLHCARRTRVLMPRSIRNCMHADQMLEDAATLDDALNGTNTGTVCAPGLDAQTPTAQSASSRLGASAITNERVRIASHFCLASLLFSLCAFGCEYSEQTQAHFARQVY